MAQMLAISSNLVWPLQFCGSSSCRYYVYVHMAHMGGPFLQEGVQLYSDTGMNILLISASVKGASHTYSRLSLHLSAWLVKSYGNMVSVASTIDCMHMLAILLSLHL